MKETELKRLLEGKDLSKAEDLGLVLKGINDSTNSIVSEKDETIKGLRDENNALKTSASAYEKEKNELNSQLTKTNETNEFLSKKLYVAKNINNELNDQDVADLLTLTNSRLAASNGAKFEDVISEVAKQRHFTKLSDVFENKAQPEPTPIPKPNSQIANVEGEGVKQVENLTKDDTLNWLGIKPFGKK